MSVCFVCCDAQLPLHRPCKCASSIHPRCLAATIRCVPAHADAICPVCRTPYANVRMIRLMYPTTLVFLFTLAFIDTGLAFLLYLLHDWNLTFCIVGAVLVVCAYACVPLLQCTMDTTRKRSVVVAMGQTVYIVQCSGTNGRLGGEWLCVRV